MANPYHDAEGKFCSRSEMQEAISEQVRLGNFDKAHELERDLAVTDKQNERMPEGWVPDLADTQCVDSEGNPPT